MDRRYIQEYKTVCQQVLIYANIFNILYCMKLETVYTISGMLWECFLFYLTHYIAKPSTLKRVSIIVLLVVSNN